MWIYGVITFVLGIIGTYILGGMLNLPDGGAVVAIAVMGTFVLNAINRNGN